MKVLSSESPNWLRASLFSAGFAMATGFTAAPSLWAGDNSGVEIEIGKSSDADGEYHNLDPANLVRDMSMALKMLNYEGKFVHVQGSNMTSMHIIHASDASGELERLISLNEFRVGH